MKERFKKIWSSNIIQRVLYLLSSIWAYAPVVGTILFWMGIWSSSIAFTSVYLFEIYGLRVGWFNKWLILDQVGFTSGIIALLVIEAIIFAIVVFPPPGGPYNIICGISLSRRISYGNATLISKGRRNKRSSK